jgi:hypothetical protein
MRSFFLSILPAFLLMMFSACNIINPKEQVPTYVQIDSFNFTGDPSKTGSNAHKITNVWVYLNNSPVGNFDLPARFPVLISSPGTLTVAPGIDFNSLTGFPAIYPLYNGDTMTLNPAPGTVVPYLPKTGYKEGAKLRFEERFDGTNSFTKGDTLLKVTSDPAKIFEGTGSGQIVLSTGVDSAIVYGGVIPYITKGADAFIEVNYKGTLTLRVGMYSLRKLDNVEYTEQLIGLKPSPDKWMKAYVSIKAFVASNEGTEYRVLIRADRPSDVTTGEALIDNVKVLSF